MRNIDRVEERDIILKKKGDLSFGKRSPMKTFTVALFYLISSKSASLTLLSECLSSWALPSLWGCPVEAL